MTLKTQQLQTLVDVRAFVDGSQLVSFAVATREAAYEFVSQQLRRFGYASLGKADKGLLRRYLVKITGLSRAQITRLITQHRVSRRIRDRRGMPPSRWI